MKRSTSKTGHRSQRNLQRRRDEKRDIWREPKPKVITPIPGIEGSKRFEIGRDEIVNYGDPALQPVKDFLVTLEAFSMTKQEIDVKIWQHEDLDFNEVKVDVAWTPYSTRAPKKRNGSLKWNQARRYSRMSPFNQLMRKIDRQVRNEVIDADTLRERMGIK